MKLRTIKQVRLKELLDYNPDTGVFTWRTTGKGRPARKNGVAGVIAPHGYMVIKIDQVTHYAHRLAWVYMFDSLPPELDHINGNRSDNRIANLRPVTVKENRHNRDHHNPSNRSGGLIGASFRRDVGKWRARIHANGVEHILGWFSTPEEAHAAYVEAKNNLHPTHMRLRNVQS